MNRELGSSFHCVFCILYLSACTHTEHIINELIVAHILTGAYM
jgi:hypothetical protein